MTLTGPIVAHMGNARSLCINHNVGCIIRAELAIRKMSVNQLAERSGIPRATLTRRLDGHHPFNFAELLAVSEALGVPPSRFIQEELLGDVS